jgi:hypothetical protein
MERKADYKNQYCLAADTPEALVCEAQTGERWKKEDRF